MIHQVECVIKCTLCYGTDVGVYRVSLATEQLSRPAKQKTGEIQELMSQGIGMSEIARNLGISRASAYRYGK